MKQIRKTSHDKKNKISTLILPQQLKSIYERGENISDFLNNQIKLDKNIEEAIELSYDLQAGAYSKGMDNPDYRRFKTVYSAEIAKMILALCTPSSVVEAGVGEATTLSGVMKSINKKDTAYYGFDLSWSRLAFAQQHLQNMNLNTSCTLFTGSLFNIPLESDSIDVVYTSHSIEPNKGNERAILSELYRIVKKYLVILEPAYELASEAAKKRMDRFGYCRGILENCNSLKYNVLKHELFPFSANPLNPTGITIISKKNARKSSVNNEIFRCPRYGTPLKRVGMVMYSNESMFAYPIIKEIPCLRPQNGIFASKFTVV